MLNKVSTKLAAKPVFDSPNRRSRLAGKTEDADGTTSSDLFDVAIFRNGRI
jgi:hypothetical protein